MDFLYALLIVIAVAVLTVAAVFYFAPALFVKIGLRFARKRAGLLRSEMEIGEGMHVAYLEGGSGDTVVLFHGFGADKDIYTDFAAELCRAYRVIIPDIIGFGESSHPVDADYAPLEQVRRLHRFLEALQTPAAHFAGNSMGGQLAITYAVAFPNAVKSLCLISPSGVWSAPKSAVVLEILESNRNPLVIRTAEEFTAALELGMLKAPKLPQPLLKVLSEARIANAELEERIIHALWETPVDEAYATLQGLPTLVIFGKHDRIILPETAQRLKAIRSETQIVIIPNVAHVAMYERPKHTAKLYMAFLETLR